MRPLHLFAHGAFVTFMFVVAVSFAVAQQTDARILFDLDRSATGGVAGLNPVVVDVAWCDEGQNSIQRASAALEVASAVAAFARVQVPTLSQMAQGPFVQTVRLSPVSLGGETAGHAKVGDTLIIGIDATMTAQFGETLVSITGRTFKLVRSNEVGPNEIRFRLCQGPISADEQRLYVHIARPSQDRAAERASDELRRSFPRLLVPYSVENVGDRAPDDTQLRYFSNSEQRAAEAFVAFIRKILNTEVKLVPMTSVATGSTLGTFELWLGKNYSPSIETKFLVCEGEHRSRCPGGQDWVPCYTDLRGWAQHAKKCTSVLLTRITTAGGNKCGYAVTQVTCMIAE